ncbi:MAG TPA: hypothetical protein VD971_06880 [Phycisphaerales bacterium]|nr:hypothetical protein [Phycisphaerales bacterium]
MSFTGSAVVAAVLAAMASLSHGQLVTPPPGQLAPVDADIPKVAPEAQKPQIQFPAGGPDGAIPINMQGGAGRTPQTQPQLQLPDLPYKSLVERDENGNVKPLSEPLHLAALRVNPMLRPDYVDTIQGYLVERRIQIENLLVSNLDLVEKIDDGIFENARPDNQQAIRDLLNVVKPLSKPNAPDALSPELRSRQMLTKEEAAFNEKIVREYTLANHSVDKAAPADERGRQAFSALVALYKQNVEEYIRYHDEAYRYAGEHLDEVVQAAGIPADAARRLKGAANNPAELKRAAREALTIEQRKALVREALNRLK